MPRLAISLCLAACASAAFAGPLRNGFDLADALVPVEAIESGGPPRDAIPAIDRPRFTIGRAAD